MQTVTKWAATALAALGVVGLSACGEDGGSDGGGAREGGQVRIGTVGPDSYDPALYGTVEAAQPLQLVYTPLTTYRHAEGDSGTEIVPGLAERLPEISDGGRTYRLRLRAGLRYSDGTRVRASDFEHAIKRLLSLEGPFSSFFGGVVGAERYVREGRESADIPGIATDDRTREITIRLTAPDGKFQFALSAPYAAPVPVAKSPFKSLTKSPPPGAGPYTLAVVDPGREFVLERNERFSVPGIPRGRIDRFTGVVSDSVPRMTREVIAGRLDFMTEDPTGDLLPQVRRRYPDRLREDPSPPNTYFFFLNVRERPFENEDARKAVNHALDSRALARIFGGRLTPSCTFLPPGVAGHETREDCPYGRPDGPPDLDTARRLVKRSGTNGTEVTVWTNNKDPRPAIGQYYADVLNDIGYEAKLKTLDEQVYFQQVGNVKTRAQTGFTNWFQDFPHPADFFEPLLGGEGLAETNNTNLGLVDDPSVNRTIARLVREPDLERVAEEWRTLDREVVDKALVVPYGHEKATSFFSERMDVESCSGVHPVWKNDWLLFCRK